MAEWVDVARVDEFEAGSFRTIDVDDVDVAVFNLDGEFYAIEDLCSHENFPLTEGCVEGGEIVCALHGARFCIKTGKVLSAPAYEDVQAFPVRIEDGMVQVTDDRWD